MEKTVLNNMFDNLLHIWNKTNFWNAKMKPYIYGSVNGIHVINLLKTQEKLEEVKKELQELTASGKKVLIVTTKIQSRDPFKRLAIDTWSYYVCDKWVPGLLTNFKTIKKRISSYLQLLSDAESGAFNMLTKKEKATKMLELEKLDKAYSWLKDMKKLPDVIFASDGIYEKQALREAEILGIKSFAIFNTNGDIDLVSNLIPANTNSTKSFDYLAEELKSAFLKSSAPQQKAQIKKVEEKPQVKKTTIKEEQVEVEVKAEAEAPKVEVKEEVKKVSTPKKEAVKKAPKKAE